MSLMERIEKHLWTIAHEAIYFTSKFIPKDKNTWVFGSWNGKLFSDNAKYLYLYIREFHPEINACWITKDKDLAKEMQKKEYKSYYFHSLKGIACSVRASVVFTTSGLGDVAEWAHPKSMHVSLWHGTPLKKIGYDNTGWGKVLAISKKQKIKNLFLPYVNRKEDNDIYVVSSEEVKRKFETAFRARSNQIYVEGQPRNDAFIRPYKNEYIRDLKSRHPGAKVICYLPTHRNFGKTDNNPLTPEVLLATDKYLRQHNIILILKPHFHEMKHYIHMAGEFTNIILGIDKEIFSDPYSFLPYCDLLISDYSSVFVDYMCSNKPVVMFPYDLDDYIKSDAGLYYEYKDIAPGHICTLWKDTMDKVCMALEENEPSEKYVKIRDMFNSYNDGNNCERVYRLVKKLQGGKAENNGK